MFRPAQRLYTFWLFAEHKGIRVVTDYVAGRDLGHATRMAAYVVRTLVRDAVPPADFDASAVTWQIVPVGPSTPASDNRLAPTVVS
jgi:hypothetical protein